MRPPPAESPATNTARALRLRAPAAPVECGHELHVQTLTQRMTGHQLGQLPHQHLVRTGRQLCIQTALHCGTSLFLEPIWMSSIAGCYHVGTHCVRRQALAA